MTVASDNPFPSLLVTEGSAPASPAAGKQRLFIDSADHVLKYKNSGGTVTNVGGAGGAVATDAIWDAAGDLAVGTGANTAAVLAKGNAGGVLAMGNGAVIWNAGTSFPASKATGDRYFRTDLGLEFYWDGTRWVTTTLYISEMPGYQVTTVNQAIASSGLPVIPHRSAPMTDKYDIYVVDFRATIRVNTTNSGSHYITIKLQKYSTAGGSVDLGSVNTSANAADTILQKTATVGAAIGTTNILLQDELSKTGTPGSIDVYTMSYSYRLIAT